MTRAGMTRAGMTRAGMTGTALLLLALGVPLGYRDKQRVLSAEKLSEDRKPLNTPADMLLRNHYLGMIGKHDLVGDDYRNAAIAMSEALNRPMQPVDDTDHLVAA